MNFNNFSSAPYNSFIFNNDDESLIDCDSFNYQNKFVFINNYQTFNNPNHNFQKYINKRLDQSDCKFEEGNILQKKTFQLQNYTEVLTKTIKSYSTQNSMEENKNSKFSLKAYLYRVIYQRLSISELKKVN